MFIQAARFLFFKKKERKKDRSHVRMMVLTNSTQTNIFHWAEWGWGGGEVGEVGGGGGGNEMRQNKRVQSKDTPHRDLPMQFVTLHAQTVVSLAV